ncbi:hypothetical protein MBCUT_05780 [Methanobrevibacter cuticularis]|uniref:Uncharacterized protein n=1 Tax=Methanobrevibacter cuticularis TaxID=47311 RepID=A0A166EJ93_9EURY|nr:hypothetical protein [Methanobrevibacter cuticularis]KZX16715.1 hypothetical protein MBCUT_05780 [Methanobrevibacter cuticularis]
MKSFISKRRRKNKYKKAKKARNTTKAIGDLKKMKNLKIRINKNLETIDL